MSVEPKELNRVLINDITNRISLINKVIEKSGSSSIREGCYSVVIFKKKLNKFVQGNLF